MSSYANLKQECLEANLSLAELRLIDLTFGNVSVIDRAAGVFAIKPSGVGYRGLSAGDMVVVDLDGRVVEGKLKPLSDTPTHRRLYRGFGQGVGAVVHTHSRNASAFAQAGREIPCLGTTHADHFHGDVPVTRAMAPSEVEGEYEWETGNVIVERFKDLDPQKICAVLVRSHGPFVWGPSAAKAVENSVALEAVAEMALKAMQINPGVTAIPQGLLDRHFLRKHGSRSYYGQGSR